MWVAVVRVSEGAGKWVARIVRRVVEGGRVVRRWRAVVRPVTPALRGGGLVWWGGEGVGAYPMTTMLVGGGGDMVEVWRRRGRREVRGAGDKS